MRVPYGSQIHFQNIEETRHPQSKTILFKVTMGSPKLTKTRFIASIAPPPSPNLIFKYGLWKTLEIEGTRKEFSLSWIATIIYSFSVQIFDPHSAGWRRISLLHGTAVQFFLIRWYLIELCARMKCITENELMQNLFPNLKRYNTLQAKYTLYQNTD